MGSIQALDPPRLGEPGTLVVDLGRAEAVMPSRERVPTEEYQIGDRIRALIVSVDKLPQGPTIILSRSHPDFVRRLFELEVFVRFERRSVDLSSTPYITSTTFRSSASSQVHEN